MMFSLVRDPSRRLVRQLKEQEKIARGFYQAEMQGSIKGVLNRDAAEEADVLVVTLPASAIVGTLSELAEHMRSVRLLCRRLSP